MSWLRRAARVGLNLIRRLRHWLTAPITCPHATPDMPECLDCWRERQW